MGCPICHLHTEHVHYFNSDREEVFPEDKKVVSALKYSELTRKEIEEKLGKIDVGKLGKIAFKTPTLELPPMGRPSIVYMTAKQLRKRYGK